MSKLKIKIEVYDLYKQPKGQGIDIAFDYYPIKEYERVVTLLSKYDCDSRRNYQFRINYPFKDFLLDRSSPFGIIAMLVLSFPDLRWITNSITTNDSEEKKIQIQQIDFDDIFDGTGLRSEIKKESLNLCRDIKKHSTREYLAVALDEEEEYAYLHAYMAYRFGYRAIPIVRYTDAQQLLNSNHETCKSYLSIEDVYLRYPDQPSDVSALWNLEVRQRHFQQLNQESPKNRHFVTSGWHSGKQIDFHDTNKKYFNSLNNINFAIHHKPTNGIFGLWKKMDVPFKPINKPNDKIIPEESHSAPGRVLLIANTLIQRAKRLRNSAISVQDYLRGATFATEAFEILDYLSPTTAVEALYLKHEFEVKAECEFIGVSYHFEIEAREKEIEQDITELAKSFARQRQKEFKLNALVTIMNRLAQVFRKAGRFEEEHECMVRMRRWHRQLVSSKPSNPFRLITNGILWYAEFLLASFPIFILAILAWLGTSTIVWWFFDDGWKAAISGVWSAFFSGTAAPPSKSWHLIGVSCVVVASGFFHLGVLVAYIYSLISRR